MLREKAAESARLKLEEKSQDLNDLIKKLTKALGKKTFTLPTYEELLKKGHFAKQKDPDFFAMDMLKIYLDKHISKDDFIDLSDDFGDDETDEYMHLFYQYFRDMWEKWRKGEGKNVDLKIPKRIIVYGGPEAPKKYKPIEKELKTALAKDMGKYFDRVEFDELDAFDGETLKFDLFFKNGEKLEDNDKELNSILAKIDKSTKIIKKKYGFSDVDVGINHPSEPCTIYFTV